MKPKMVRVAIQLSDSVFLKLALMAHEQDITFNELVRRILQERMLKEKAISR